MSRPYLRVAVVLISALGASAIALADTGSLPSGTLSFPKLFIHEDGSSAQQIASTPTVQAQYFNLAHCICSQAGSGSETTFAEQIQLTGYQGPTATIPLQIWLGTECDVGSANDVIRMTDCTMVPSGISNYSTLEVSPASPEISLFTFMNPNPSLMITSCNQAAVTDTYWVEGDTDMDGELDYSISTTIDTDTLPPPTPTNFKAEGAESAIQISWDPPTTNTGDIYYYQAFCADANGNPPASPGASPKYVVADQLCGVSQGVTLTPTAVDVTVEPTGDAGVVDAGSTTVTTAPTGLATLDPSFLCGEAQSTAASMRLTGLTNGMPYTVAVIVTDLAGNPAGNFFTSTLTPEPVTDFWEDLHARGSKVDGGFCLLAETYGEDSALTSALRAFRDDNLASTSVGRWLTDAYYAVIAPIGAYVHGSLAARIVAGILLAPVVAIALAWHAFTLPGLLLLLGFGLALRRRRRVLRQRLVLAAATVCVLALAPLHVARADGASPYWDDDAAQAEEKDSNKNVNIGDYDQPSWHVGLRAGPYTPQIDSQLGGPSGVEGPYKEMFGGAAIMPALDIDRFLISSPTFGQFGVGLSAGFMTKKAHPFLIGSSPTENGDRERSPGDENSFRMIPLSVVAVYRATQLDDLYGIPVVPFVRAGLGYYAWWVTAPDGNFATVCKATGLTTDTCPGGSLNHADGASLGLVGTFGIQIRAERIDSSAAQSMRESGLLHAGFFFEYQLAWVDGFGSDSKLSVGDNTWFGGVDFEF